MATLNGELGLTAPVEDETEESGEGKIERKLSKKEQAELLRRKVDTIGRPGEPGEKIHNVISVGMLSEGWDARTVIHIMGLRRTSYDVDEKSGFFLPEYVNIFGVPFTFLPHEGGGDEPPPAPTTGKTRIEALSNRKNYEIVWPNVLRVDHEYRPTLILNMDTAKPLRLDARRRPPESTPSRK